MQNQPGVVAQPRPRPRVVSGPWLRRWGTLLGFALLMLTFALLRPTVFLSARNLGNIVEQLATLTIVAATVTLVMVNGDFDLSVGSLASLAGVVAADLMVRTQSVALGVVAALLVGLFGGALNGALVAWGGISAFVATLATMTAFGGAAMLYTDGATIFSGLPEAFRVLGQGALGPLPVSVLIALVVVGLVWLLLEQTTFGRRLYAVGVLSGLGAALAGVVLTSRLFSAHPQAGEPFMLNAAAAVFLGATSLREGEPHILGTLLGVLIIGVLGNGLNILGVNSYVQAILTGAVIVGAVLLSGLARRRR
jgi:ribose transport system permease protein